VFLFLLFLQIFRTFDVHRLILKVFSYLAVVFILLRSLNIVELTLRCHYC